MEAMSSRRRKRAGDEGMGSRRRESTIGERETETLEQRLLIKKCHITGIF